MINTQLIELMKKSGPLGVLATALFVFDFLGLPIEQGAAYATALAGLEYLRATVVTPREISLKMQQEDVKSLREDYKAYLLQEAKEEEQANDPRR